MNLSLGINDSLEWLTKFRDHWFIIKGYNSGTARWKRGVGQDLGKGYGASTPSPGAPLSPNLHTFINREVLSQCLLTC